MYLDYAVNALVSYVEELTVDRQSQHAGVCEQNARDDVPERPAAQTRNSSQTERSSLCSTIMQAM